MEENLKIWKYEMPLKSKTSIDMPQGAVFFDKGMQGEGELARHCLWFMVNPDNALEARNFLVVDTGESFKADVAKLIPMGTIDDGDGHIAHFFEILD